MPLFLVWIACAVVCGALASGRNRSTGWWTAGGLLFGPLALLVLLFLTIGDASSMQRRCPYCDKRIRCDARQCKYCGRAVEPLPLSCGMPPDDPPPPPEDDTPDTRE